MESRIPFLLLCAVGLVPACTGFAGGDGDPSMGTEDGQVKPRAPVMPRLSQPERTLSPQGSDASLRYPRGRVHSPITAAVVEHWRDVAARAPDRRINVFSKIGDSQTVSEGFLHCFAKSSVEFAAHEESIPLPSGPETLQDTVRFFLRDDQGRLTFDRTSLAAKVGARTSFALAGPLAREVDATNARFAVVLFGGNDIMDAPTGGIFTFAKNMFAITDELLARGVVPILTTNVPKPIRAADVPRFGKDGADPWVPRYAAVVRGIAEARKVPLVDLEQELRKLPDFGVGADRLHLYSSALGACHFTEAGLTAGMNVRNLVTLQALHRARIALEHGLALDEDVDRAPGGTASDPAVIDSLPFGDFASTGASGESRRGAYVCPSGGKTIERKGAARERVYKLTVDSRQRVRATVFSQGAADLDVYLLLDGSKTCVGRADKEVDVIVDPGRYEIVVDSESPEDEGEFLLTVLRDDA